MEAVKIRPLQFLSENTIDRCFFRVIVRQKLNNVSNLHNNSVVIALLHVSLFRYINFEFIIGAFYLSFRWYRQVA